MIEDMEPVRMTEAAVTGNSAAVLGEGRPTSSTDCHRRVELTDCTARDGAERGIG
jgi:hypothetical protein